MEKTNRMKHISILTALALACTLTTGASAQNINRLEKGQEIPDGVVIYSLPLTTIRLDVEAVCETYTPGPYCQWAKKYLGIDVPQEAGVSYTLSRVEMTPYLEADRSCSYIINLDGFLGKASPASFFEFSTQGLIVLSDENKGSGNFWRFPTIATGADALGSEATGNLTSTETTLYRTVRNDRGGYDRVAVRQSQVVEKSPENKAKEAASMILSLRQHRIDIITGNTDATFSGDALRAAVEEIGRLEDEYMSLFTGTSVTSVQTRNFDIVPASGGEEELKKTPIISCYAQPISPLTHSAESCRKLLLCGEKSVRLSAKEFDVMRALLQAGSANLSKESILARVWGYDSNATENHVEVYVGFLRKKLASIGSNIRITAIRRLGYHLEVDEPC